MKALVVAALVLSLGACRSSAGPAGGPPPLEVGAAALDLGETAAVERQLEPLFADGVAASSGERFWSGWMLAQARALGALESSGSRTSSSARAEALAAALYFAQQAAAEEAGARVLAPTLAPDGPRVADAARGLDLMRATWLSELGFADRAAWTLDQLPGLAGTGDLAAMLSRAGLHERLEPRVWKAVFDDRARRAPGEAFPFAVGTLTASDGRPGSLEPQEVRAVEAWIEQGAPFVFRCPDCGQPALPQLRACPNDQTRLERFEPARRP